MKKYISIFVLSFCIVYNADSQNWQWAVSCGKSNGNDFGRLAIDNNANLYLTSIFYSPRGVFGTDTLIPVGVNDIAFSKLDNSGNFIWTRQIGGNNSVNYLDAAQGICYDLSSNNVCLAGTFEGTITLGANSLSSGGGSDIFFSKYDVNGNCTWAKKAGGNNADYGSLLDADGNGNTYATGQVGDTAYFDSYTVPRGFFFAKYDNNGNCVWAKKILDNPIGGSQPDAYITSVSCYNNEILLSGWTTNDTVIIDNDTLFAANPYGYDLLLAKFNSNGNLLWAKRDGGGVISSIIGAKYDNSGNIYSSGTFGGDTAYFNGIILPIALGIEIFLVKYDNNGNALWARQSVNSNNCRTQSLSVSQSDGSIYLTGNFQGSLTMGTHTVNTNGGGDVDMYIARYATGGDCLGIRNTKADMAGPSPGGGYSIVQDASNNCYVAGQFTGTSNFDSHSITSVWQKDIFVAKSSVITGIGGEGRSMQTPLIIYANPNKGTFNIKVPDEVKTFKDAVLIVYDNAGKETARFALDNKSDMPHFDVANAVSGMYTVKLMQGEKSYTGKLVVQ